MPWTGTCEAVSAPLRGGPKPGGSGLLRGGLSTLLAAVPSQPLWSLAAGLIGACALFSYVVRSPKRLTS